MRNGFMVSRMEGLLATLCIMMFSAKAADILPPGFRPLPPGTHALVGGKVIPKPGEVLDGGVVIIRDGRITTVESMTELEEIEFPPQSRGQRLTFQALVTARKHTLKLSYWVQPR